MANVHFVKCLPFQTVLMEAWYALMDVMKTIKTVSKVYDVRLKCNRLFSTSVETPYQRVEELSRTDAQATQGRLIHIKKFPKGHQVKLFRLRSNSGDMEYIATNDLSQSDVEATQQKCCLCWKVEKLHRELKQTPRIDEYRHRKHRVQCNHIACCMRVWICLKRAAGTAGQTIYQLKESLLHDYNNFRNLLFLSILRKSYENYS